MREYRIDYVAPGDARNTGLTTGSIDFVCSTSTLEHIPLADIKSIVTECTRICRIGALLSMVIDYHDHYATADHAISRFNFYKFPDWLWWWYSPSNHFQNRLRHGDYERLFAGFESLENHRVIPEGGQSELARVRAHSRFQRYNLDDLLALNGIFTLRVR